MKKISIVFLVLVCLATKVFSQPSTDTSAPYLKHVGLPPFSMVLYDSSNTISHQFLIDKPIVALVYFSPTCGHCQDQAKELINHIDSLTAIFFVWIGPSHSTQTEINDFAIKYKLNSYKNVLIGKEIQYSLPPFYRMQTTPYCAVYKKNELFVEFRNGIIIKDFISINNNLYNPIPLMNNGVLQHSQNPSLLELNKKYKKPS